MNQEKISKFFNAAVIALGSVCFTFAILNLETKVINWGFIALFVFTLIVSTRLSLMMPRSNFAISFSDAAIFLAFLFFGGETAIILAPLEVVVSCLYLKNKGKKFPSSII